MVFVPSYRGEKRMKEDGRGRKRRKEGRGDRGRLRKIGRRVLLLRLKTQYNDTPFYRNYSPSVIMADDLSRTPKC